MNNTLIRGTMELSPMLRSAYRNASLMSAVVVGLAWLAMGPLVAQTSTGTPAPTTQTAVPAPSQSDVQTPVKLTPKQIREAQITADAEKLFQLAQQLKVEVDKSSKDTMSLSVIKKSEEIEKLARTLKQEIRAN